MLVLLRRARKRRETGTADMPHDGAGTRDTAPAYQYTPVHEHKYAHGGAATGPVTELPSAENNVSEMGVTSPMRGPSELLGAGSPHRGR